MTKRKFSILIMIVCFILIVGMLCGCKNSPDEGELLVDVEPISMSDEEIMERLDDYFHVDFEVLENFGGFTKAYVVLVKTNNTIESSLRKETINGIEFKYSPYMRLYAVTPEEVLNLKDAFLDVQIDSISLREVKVAYDGLYKTVDVDEYLEIGEPIVLSEKNIWDETYEQYYDFKYHKWKYFEVDYQTIKVKVDGNFSNHQFTIDDFNMLILEDFELETKSAFTYYKDGVPLTYRHVIKLKIKNKGENNLTKAIRILEELDFVISARPYTPSVRFF